MFFSNIHFTEFAVLEDCICTSFNVTVCRCWNILSLKYMHFFLSSTSLWIQAYTHLFRIRPVSGSAGYDSHFCHVFCIKTWF